MKKILALWIFLFLNFLVSAQNNDIWTSFPNKDTTLIGFKDKNGNVKIEPKFSGFTTARQFENIIAVTEEKKGKWESYYLTKSGKIIGRDSLYVFDNGPDCENEGFIRFTDRKTDKMGIFNSDGKIVIPAEYSNLTKVKNGMFIGLKDAKKETDGEHSFWTGGKEFLVDIHNKILVESFTYNDDLNFYSVEKSKEPSKDPIRDNFLGVDGQYYSFINFGKEFKEWLQNTFLKNLSKANLEKHSFDKITYWKEPNGWISEPKTKFVDQNYTYLKLKLEELKNPKTDYFVTSDGLNQFIFETEEYDIYFNNCNESKDWIYPVKSIIINPKNKADFKQDHFEFLRTENGYKLISISLAKDNLK
ncbi:WG repeat-containing protein [Flavobacterium phragmitis]|uniref:WG containing repeat-containing protein n=1 Tax=Flavobacterium phragmitis TaxID=739143 RepID=A0A1I1QUI5_9FLAO|nr:WG repeat-containing protein [Flavobacterium phragmitis]SFD25781.1 WG containing repeat-containing protein [Flavobacterium phragmitis]